MLRRDDRDRLLGDVDAEAEQLLVDVGEMRTDELRSRCEMSRWT
jgi:hypothetical protein